MAKEQDNYEDAMDCYDEALAVLDEALENVSDEDAKRVEKYAEKVKKKKAEDEAKWKKDDDGESTDSSKPSDSGQFTQLDLTAFEGYEIIYFKDGIVRAVDAEGRYGILDYNGNVIVPFKYVDSYIGYNGFSAVNDGKYYEIYDSKGNSYQKSDYVYFSDYFYAVGTSDRKTPQKYQIYSYDGELVYETDIVYSFVFTKAYDGEAQIQLFYDRKDDAELAEEFENEVRQKNNYPDYYIVHIGSIGEVRNGIIDKNGSIKWAKSDYSYGYSYEDPSAQAMDGGVSGLAVFYYYYGPYVNGYCMAEIVGWGKQLGYEDDGSEYYDFFWGGSNKTLISEDGTDLMNEDIHIGINCFTDYIRDYNGIYNNGNKVIVQPWNSETWGYDNTYQLCQVTPTGLVPIVTYNYIQMTTEKYMLASNGDRWGYIDFDGKEIAFYDDASCFCDGYAGIVENGIGYIINDRLEKVMEAGEAKGTYNYGDAIVFKCEDGTLVIYTID